MPENTNNEVELVEKQETDEESVDLPPKVKKLFNMEDY